MSAFFIAARGGVAPSRPYKSKPQQKTCTWETWPDDPPPARSMSSEHAESVVWLFVGVTVLFVALMAFLERKPEEGV